MANFILPTHINYLKQVYWYRSQFTLKKLSLPLTINSAAELFKSKNYLILNKPYDLIVYHYKKETKSMPSLYELMKDKYSYYYDPRLTGGFHVLHRLDSVTSGCICVPLNYYSQNYAAKAFENNQVNKYYLALVYGKVNYDEIQKFAGVGIDRDKEIVSVQVPIGDDVRNHGYKRCTANDKTGSKLDYCANAQKTHTQFRILEYGTYKGRDCTKVLLKPITGKRHQLRVVMDYLGYPIVGDTNYGVDDFDAYRTMLHSYKIEIRINTKEREFVKGKAPDPFLNSVDPDWKPHTIINELKI